MSSHSFSDRFKKRRSHCSFVERGKYVPEIPRLSEGDVFVPSVALSVDHAENEVHNLPLPLDHPVLPPMTSTTEGQTESMDAFKFRP